MLVSKLILSSTNFNFTINESINQIYIALAISVNKFRTATSLTLEAEFRELDTSLCSLPAQQSEPFSLLTH